MSHEQDKIKNSKRRLKDENAIKKQVKIAKQHATSEYTPGDITQPHRLVKKHAMDCGNPECFLCGNPRKTHKDKLTTQEKRMFQDMDGTTDKKSNGLPIKDTEDERED